MKLIDKYLFSQVFRSFLFGLAVLLIVWIAPELLPKIVRQIVSSEITALDGFLILLYELPEVIVKSLPMAILIGALLAFDRLSKDSEITAMRACGISIYRMLYSIMVLGIFVSISGIIINEIIVPPTSLSQAKIANHGKLTSNHFTFVDKNENNIIKQVVLIEEFDGKKINKIRIIDFKASENGKANIENIIAATSGEWDKDHWNLNKGISYKLSKHGIYEDTIYFDEKKVDSNPNAYKLLTMSLKSAKNMNLIEIKNHIAALIESQHSDEARYFRVRFHQKFSQPLAAIILGIVGVILGLHPPRSSRFVGYTVGMFVILSYYFLWPISVALGNVGALPPLLAAWLPNILAIIIGFIVLRFKAF